MNQETNQYPPELSIVIPAYNAERHIVRTLTTLVNQTVSDDKYQIILVDDGSTDDTLHLCRKFAEKHPNIYVIHQENGGVSSARNAGIEAATGKWISFVDSDDYVDSSYVETVIRVCPGAEYIIFDNYLEQRQGLTKEKKWLQPFFNKMAGVSEVLLWVCNNRLNAPWDKRFSLDVINQNHIRFRNGINMGEDLLFNFEYVLCAASAFVSDQTIYIHVDNLEGLCKQKVSEKRLGEYEAIYHAMTAACEETQIVNAYGNAINLTFLRIVAKYAGQLHGSGFSNDSIAECLNKSPMVQKVLAQQTVSLKDKARKLLLKMRLYGVCASVFQ